jgi:hypothetical protein
MRALSHRYPANVVHNELPANAMPFEEKELRPITGICLPVVPSIAGIDRRDVEDNFVTARHDMPQRHRERLTGDGG